MNALRCGLESCLALPQRRYGLFPEHGPWAVLAREVDDTHVRLRLRIVGNGDEPAPALRAVETVSAIESVPSTRPIRLSDATGASPAAPSSSATRAACAAVGVDGQRPSLRIDEKQPCLAGC
jgi:hypothetical protein